MPYRMIARLGDRLNEQLAISRYVSRRLKRQCQHTAV